jgi:hypothetical protein
MSDFTDVSAKNNPSLVKAKTQLKQIGGKHRAFPITQIA